MDLEKERHIGTIRKWVDERAFGFIRADNGDEFFFHKNALDAPFEPAENRRVSFVLGIDARSGRRQAQRVRVFQGSIQELEA